MADISMQTGKNGAAIAVGFSKYILELIRFGIESENRKEMLESLRTIYGKAADDPFSYNVYEITQGNANAVSEELKKLGYDAEVSAIEGSLLITNAPVDVLNGLSQKSNDRIPEDLSNYDEFERVYGGWQDKDGNITAVYYPGGVHYDAEAGGFIGGEDGLAPSDPKHDEILQERIENAERIEQSAAAAGGYFYYIPELGVMYSKITGDKALLIDKEAYDREQEAFKNLDHDLGHERSREDADEEKEEPDNAKEESQKEEEKVQENQNPVEENQNPSEEKPRASKKKQEEETFDEEQRREEHSDERQSEEEPFNEGQRKEESEGSKYDEEKSPYSDIEPGTDSVNHEQEHTNQEQEPADIGERTPEEESVREQTGESASENGSYTDERVAEAESYIHDSSDEKIVNDVIGEKQKLEEAKAEKAEPAAESPEKGSSESTFRSSEESRDEFSSAGNAFESFENVRPDGQAAKAAQAEEAGEGASSNRVFTEEAAETSEDPFSGWLYTSEKNTGANRDYSHENNDSTNYNSDKETKQNVNEITKQDVSKEAIHENNKEILHGENTAENRASAAEFSENKKNIENAWAAEPGNANHHKTAGNSFESISNGESRPNGFFNTETGRNGKNIEGGTKETNQIGVWENGLQNTSKAINGVNSTEGNGLAAKNAVNATIGTYALNASHLSSERRFTAADIKLHVVPGASPADVAKLGKAVQAAAKSSASGSDKTVSTALRSAGYTRQVFQAMNRAVGINAEKNISKMLQNYAAGDGDAFNVLNNAFSRIGVRQIDASKIGRHAFVSENIASTMKRLKKAGIISGGSGFYRLSRKMASMSDADFLEAFGITKQDAKQLIEYSNRSLNFPHGGNPVKLLLRVAGNQLRNTDESLSYGVNAAEATRETIRLTQKLIRHNSLQARAARLGDKVARGKDAQLRTVNGKGKLFDEHRVEAGKRAEKKLGKVNEKIEKKLNKKLLHQQRQQKIRKIITKPAAKVRNLAGKQAAWIKTRPMVVRTGRRVANASGAVRASLHRTSTKFFNTWVGKATAKFGRGTMKVGRTIGKGFSLIGRGLSNAAEAIASAFHVVLIALLKFLGIYALALAIGFIALTGMSFLLFASTSEVGDNWKDGAPDKFDKSDTVFGMVYDELRWKEIDWANTLRSYGTVDQKTSIPISGDGSDNISFTAEGVDAKTYVQSQAGVDDLLGSWAVDTDGKEGVEGPEPFDGAMLSDYKVLKNIDAGNSLELRGKPMDGYTSNAKEVTAMGTVFYNQDLEALQDGDMNPITKFLSSITNKIRDGATWIEMHHVPIASDLVRDLGWSWTSMLRNYCFPLFTESHRANFRLSSYIMPTKWTDPNLVTDTNDDYSYEQDAEALPVDHSHGKTIQGESTITASNQLSDSTALIVSPNAYYTYYDPTTGEDITGSDPANFNYNMPSVGSADYDQIDDLYRTIYTETYMRMSNVGGIVAEGELIMNRVQSDRYPSTVSAVVSQKGQFSAYGSSRWKNAKIDRNSNLYHLVAQIYVGNISILNNSSITEQRAETSSDVQSLIARGYTYVGAAGGQAYFMRPGDEPEPVNGGGSSRGYTEDTESGRTVVTNIQTGIKRNANAAEATANKTGIHKNARYDMNQETKTANAGDVAVNKNYTFSDIFYTSDAAANAGGTTIQEGATAKSGTIGNPKEGGTGKIDVKNRINRSVWQVGFNEIMNEEEGWQGFTSCGQLTYLNNNKKEVNDGYGCMTRSDFSYKWTGNFVTDVDGIPAPGADTNGAQFLYYGNPDAWGTKRETDTSEAGTLDDNGVLHKKSGQPVYADVSPFGTNEDYEKQIADDCCLKDIRVLSNDAAACWAIDTENNNGYEDISDYSPAFRATNDSKYNNSQKFNSSYLTKALLSGYTWIDKVTTTARGCDVTVARIRDCVEEPVRDRDGKIVYEADGITPKYTTTYYYSARTWHLKHDCVGNHRGYYCGGHLQLRTTGVVYGFSKEEMGFDTEVKTVSAEQLKEDPKSAENLGYVPKYLDPDDPYDDELFKNNVNMCLGDDAKLTEFSPDTAPKPDSATGAAAINKELSKRVKYAEDLFDIDIMIARHKDEYSFYSSRTGGINTGIWQIDAMQALLNRTDILDNWASWTESNMSVAIGLVSTDWKEEYGVVDTQTMVGGMASNSVYETVRTNVMTMLAGTANLEAYGDDEDSINVLKQQRKQYGNAVVNGKELSIEEELEYADRLRHVKYALTTIGEVGYSQQEHGNWYGNLRGNNTDCSGYVANIWRDVFGGGSVPTTSALKAYGSAYVHPYTGSGCGIQPGDIIIRHPDSADAHALLYLGNLDKKAVYSESIINPNDIGQGEQDSYVYTLDCSTMTANNSDQVYAIDDAIKKYLSTDGSSSTVRGGNVRFSARKYLQNGLSDYSDTYYIDMEALAKDKRTGKWLRDDFDYLGDSSGNRDYWDMMNDDREGYLSALPSRNVLSIGDVAKTTDKGTEWKKYKAPKNTSTVDPYPYKYTSTSGTDEQNAIVEYAMQFLGNPYVWGGTDLVNGTDCSGFTQGVYAYFGYSLPRTTYSQVNSGIEIHSLADAQPGDLLFYHGTGHVAIYIGDGKIVHASNHRDGIKVSKADYSTVEHIRRIVDGSYSADSDDNEEIGN